MVEEADLPLLMSEASLEAYLEATERHIAAISAAIDEHGERAALEALRRRGVLVEEEEE